MVKAFVVVKASYRDAVATQDGRERLAKELQTFVKVCMVLQPLMVYCVYLMCLQEAALHVFFKPMIKSGLITRFTVMKSAPPDGKKVEPYLLILTRPLTNPPFPPLQEHLSAHEYPRAIDFMSALPKTSSGKIQRHLLRQGAEGERLKL